MKSTIAVGTAMPTKVIIRTDRQLRWAISNAFVYQAVKVEPGGTNSGSDQAGGAEGSMDPDMGAIILARQPPSGYRARVLGNNQGHRPARRCPCSVQVRVGLDDTDLLGLWALLALGDLELDPCPVIEGLVAVHVDRGEVDEHVLPTVDRDKAVALLAVEPLD